MQQLVAQNCRSHLTTCTPFCRLLLVCCSQDHLSVYSLMDISLDTFPYSGEYSVL
jgi:hypothetical protein